MTFEKAIFVVLCAIFVVLQFILWELGRLRKDYRKGSGLASREFAELNARVEVQLARKRKDSN